MTVVVAVRTLRGGGPMEPGWSGRHRRRTRLLTATATALVVIGMATMPMAPAVAASAPPAPTEMTVVQVGPGQAMVSWTSVNPGTGHTVTGCQVTTTLAGDAPGPGCTAQPTETACMLSGIGGTVTISLRAIGDQGPGSPTSEQVVILNALPPPAPSDVRARPGAAPGSVVVTWKAITPTGQEAQPASFSVSAAPIGGEGSIAQCDASAPRTTCQMTGLRPGTAYSVEVRAAATIWLASSPAPAVQVRVPSRRIPGTVAARFCSGSEIEVANQRDVRPSQVILDCDAYGPQYGAPPVRSIDGIRWSRWTKTAAEGTGMLHWQTAKACDPEAVSRPMANCGIDVVDLPATIRLASPQPLNKAGSRYAFREVGLFPTGPGPGGCESSCWFTPERIAYQ